MPNPAPYTPLEPVNIVIPVYRDFALTRHCIESVLASADLIPFELIVVDDCSPEPGLSAWLREQAEQGHFILLTNPDNLGFVGSVNRAMRLHKNRDVVLLNSDTEVPHGWLDRLHRHAYSAANIGTVTPFSNNATLCSYPAYPHGSDLPKNWSVAELDALFQQCNAGEQVPIPTAVGFCMYIRHGCLQETGLFDEEAFGKGYGEENDFCMRASQGDWKHLLAGDCFVGHIGAISFSDTRHQLQDSARRVILQRYPNYDQLIADFIANDPIHPLRKAVDITRLANGKRPVILTVSHQGGGGVEKHLRHFANQYADQLDVLTLEPRDNGWATLFWNSEHERFNWGFQQHHAAGILPWLVEHCGIQRLYIHHLLGYSPELVQVLLNLGLPYDLMLHDYFYICPQIHLQAADHRYCGEPDEAGCNRCLQQRPTAHADDITTWRTHYAKILHQAQNLFAPSFDTAARYLRHHPELPIQILPHDNSQARQTPVIARRTSQRMLHIAVLGALGYGKGFETLRQAALQAQARQLPLCFTLLGYGDALLPETPLTSLLVTGRYQDTALPTWLQRIQPDIVWFPAQIPETYSYTLSSALNAGLPVVVTNLGALPERVANRPWSWVMPWDSSVDQWLSFFADIRQQHFNTEQAPTLPVSPSLPNCNSLQSYPIPTLHPAAENTKPVTAQTIKRQIYGYPALDISIVTYNSAGWLDSFFESLLKGDYPLYQIRLLIRDNGSKDDTFQCLETWLDQLQSQLAGYNLSSGENLGFGQGHNYNLKQAQADYFLVTNVDLEFAPDTLVQLVETANEDQPTTACWEARQTPYEHPKHYDPVTLETPWCSSACTLFRTTALRQINGYEPRIFMYGEDVEISYRLRENGYHLRYVPHAQCHHYTYTNPEAGPTALQLNGALYASVALRMRYANRKEILAGWRQLLSLYRYPPAPTNRWQLTKIIVRLLRDAHHYLSSHATSGMRFPFNGLDYEVARAGAFVPSVPVVPKTAPLISLVVVTAGFTLEKIRNLLISIRNQTWPNLEIIVIDDEQARAQALTNLILGGITTVHYYSAHWENHAQAGNHGLQLAQGVFIGLLNPDAILYADHCSTLVDALLKHPSYGAAYSSYATPNLRELAQGSILPEEIIYNAPFIRHRLWIWNHLCQHTVLFRSSLFTQLGGFAKSLNAYEDWHLWVKYSMDNIFYPLNKTTVILQTCDSDLANRQGSSAPAEKLNQALAQQHQPEEYQLMLKELSANRHAS